MEYWVEVAFKLPMKQLFTYTASQLLAIGARVVAPFGSRDLVGFVVASGEGFHELIIHSSQLNVFWIRECSF